MEPRFSWLDKICYVYQLISVTGSGERDMISPSHYLCMPLIKIYLSGLPNSRQETVHFFRLLIIHSVNVYLIDFVIGSLMITPRAQQPKWKSDSYQTKRLMIRKRRADKATQREVCFSESDIAWTITVLIELPKKARALIILHVIDSIMKFIWSYQLPIDKSLDNATHQ